jgi:hypothetical protein
MTLKDRVIAVCDYGCFQSASTGEAAIVPSAFYHQFNNLEAGNRERHDNQQKYQRALCSKRLAARLFDLSQNPVGTEIEDDRGDCVIKVLHRLPRLASRWIDVESEQVDHHPGDGYVKP